MKTKIEIIGDVTDAERGWLDGTVRSKSWSDFVPGDGVVISQKDGEPPRIAYLNRRIHVNAGGVACKLIFEVGVQKQVKEVQIDKQELFNKLHDFAIRKSAAFNRPETAARELVNFFVNYVQGD